MIIDTHAHYDDEAFDTDREAVLASLHNNGTGKIIDVASTAESLAKVADLMHRYDFIYGAFGLHPDEAGDFTPELAARLKDYLKDPKAAAVGEIGLDMSRTRETEALQIKCFRQQIELALEAEKPVLVHSRDAAGKTMEIIEEYYGKGGRGEHVVQKGILHCYSYSPEQAKIYTGLGFCLGIGGVVTFKNAVRLKETVREIPLRYLVLETDCPYLSPEPFRGQRNSSLRLPLVIEAIAGLRGISPGEVEKATQENAERIFGRTFRNM